MGATTDEDRLPEPLRSRFIRRQRLEFYSDAELAEVLARAAKGRGTSATPDALELLAGASRDTPREGLALLQAACDEARASGASEIDAALVQAALLRTGATPDGLTALEREYLSVLARAGRPLGLSTLAARLGTKRRTLLRVYEPFLLRRGLVTLTSMGRSLVQGRNPGVAALLARSA